MVGIDPEGIDLRIADRLRRIRVSRPIASSADAREVLVEMPMQPRGG